ncbi:NUDIX domain-containing protein [Rhizobium leguminosarum bv. viciae]|nr:NUDIX domain-containing protein [Rhizobium leguminosarum bv. viciae]
MIVEKLAQQYPRARHTFVDQPLSEADFQAQKHKHFSRKAQGGAVGIIRNTKGQVVLVERSGMHAGWALPGGTVEAGEDFSAAFCREIAEEVGISLRDLELVEIEQKKFLSPDGVSFDLVLAVFKAKMVEDDLPEQTSDAIAEGLEVALFDLSSVPEEMILGDREKIRIHSLDTAA